jgi:aryl-alcohol dehydrogenase-like predicted oxidoreductase
VHTPDPSTPEQETLEALDSLVQAGKVRYLGHSNYASWQLADAAAISRENRLASYISAQNQYNLLDRAIERELIPACRHFGVGILPYFPLASGFLTGKYKRGAEISKDTRFGASKRLADSVLSDANYATLEKLEKFAHSRERGLLDLAVSWLAAHEEVSSVICGATKPEQVTENVAALSWKMTPDELKEANSLAPLA